MRHIIALMLLVAVVASGCVAIQRTPTETTVSGLRAIAIVPVEAPPLFLESWTEADRAAVAAAGLALPARQDIGGLYSGWYLLFGAFCGPLCGMVGEFYASSRPRAGETATMTRAEPPPWMLTAGLARTAAQLLQRAGTREAFVVEGYVQLPIEHRSVNVKQGIVEMENWMAPIRRWYNSEVPIIDYTQLGAPRADVILEVGVLGYGYQIIRLLLQVVVKLSDPTTKQVLGRARNLSMTKAEPLAQMLQDQGQPLRRLIETTGEALLTQCLKDLGLIPR